MSNFVLLYSRLGKNIREACTVINTTKVTVLVSSAKVTKLKLVAKKVINIATVIVAIIGVRVFLFTFLKMEMNTFCLAIPYNTREAIMS